MSKKRIDFSVLPDGFLIQKPVRTLSGGKTWAFDKMDSMWRTYQGAGLYRPALNHWHFNDGSMVLPDGLVVYVFRLDHGQNEMYRCHIDGGLVNESIVEHCFFGHDISCNYEVFQISQDVTKGAAIKVIGAHPDYADHAKELGMEVIEI